MDNGSNQGGVATLGGEGRAAYEVLVRSHYRQVFAVCLGMLTNVHDAEDAAQETMLRGLVKRPDRDDQGFRCWIVRVARNLCIDLLRKRKRPRPPAEEPAVQLRQDVNALYDLEQAMGRLPMELRLPLLMYYFDGRSAANIAESLSVSHATACQRLRAARRQLHDLMTEGTGK
jgi:RNA polymerase sigma-70 factor (ECF subfamily)